MSSIFFLRTFWVGVPILSILLGLIVGLGAHKFAMRYSKQLGWTMPGTAVVLGILVAVASFFFGFTRAINGMGEPIAIVAPDNSIVALAGQHRDIVWRWDKRLRGNRVIDLTPVAYGSISMELQPITSNPKVRPLRYSVSIGAPGTPDARLKYLDKFGYLHHSIDSTYDSSLEDFIKFQLYEFDEHHSKELALLYNPLDERQQAQLLTLLRANIGPVLENAGLSVRNAGFDFISVSDLIAKKSKG